MTRDTDAALLRLANQIVTVPGSFAWWDALLAGDEAARAELQAFLEARRPGKES